MLMNKNYGQSGMLWIIWRWEIMFMGQVTIKLLYAGMVLS